MSTLLQCLESLPPGLELRDLSAVRDETATIADYIARLLPHQQESDGYEVHRKPRDFGQSSAVAVGLVCGPGCFSRNLMDVSDNPLASGVRERKTWMGTHALRDGDTWQSARDADLSAGAGSNRRTLHDSLDRLQFERGSN